MAYTREPSSDPWGRPGRARDIWPPLLVLLGSGVVLTLVALGAPPAVRAVPVLTYVALVPGLACVRLLRMPDRLLALLLGVALSLALGTIVALAMVYLHLWSPSFGIAALAAVASVAAVTELFIRWLMPWQHSAPSRPS